MQRLNSAFVDSLTVLICKTLLSAWIFIYYCLNINHCVYCSTKYITVTRIFVKCMRAFGHIPILISRQNKVKKNRRREDKRKRKQKEKRKKDLTATGEGMRFLREKEGWAKRIKKRGKRKKTLTWVNQCFAFPYC